jgi:hypothetical protein
MSGVIGGGCLCLTPSSIRSKKNMSEQTQ